MRALLLPSVVAWAACGGSVAPVSAPASPSRSALAKSAAVHANDVLDAITVLSADPEAYARSYLVPGIAALEIGGPQIQAPPAAPELEVTLLDEQSTMVRAAVRFDGIGFALWTERARLLEIVTHEQRVSENQGGGWLGPDSGVSPYAELRSGARVRVLGHKATWTQVRYLGALEIDGWVPDAALTERTRGEHHNAGRFPSGMQSLMVLPGTVIRTEPKWVAQEIAVVANGYLLDVIQPVDEAWSAVAYEDGDVRVRGYASKHDPPGQVHRPHEADTPLPGITANAQLPRGTCLYGSQHGEPIGFLLAAHDGELSSSRTPGWFTLSFDTPWGPITFMARGPSELALATCGPPVPAPPAPPAP
ncbi:MAG: hypothetical protein ABJE66_36185 [Deltaproteobacteria bacterium]